MTKKTIFHSTWVSCFWLLSIAKSIGQEVKTFANLDAVLSFAKTQNSSFEQAALQSQLAKLTKQTAIGNVLNPRVPASVQVLDHIKQQMSFLPGQAFGMPEGTFKAITMGQQYASTLSVQPQFDILNLSSWAQIKSASINQDLVDNQNQMNEQKLYDQINMTYFNLISMQGQQQILKENIQLAQNVALIMQNKFKEGLARKQDLNEALSNLLGLQDKMQQLEWNMKIQHQILDLYFENRVQSEVIETVWEFEKTAPLQVANNPLWIDNAELQKQMAQQDKRVLMLQNVPVLSFVSSFNWQNLSNDGFFAASSNGVSYHYVGLKLSYDFPTTVQKIANLKSKSVQLEQLENQAQHVQKEQDHKNKQMQLEFEKAKGQVVFLKQIFELKKDSYEKNFNQFKENILPLDKLLLSQTDMLNSQLQWVVGLSNVGYCWWRIRINNQFLDKETK